MKVLLMSVPVLSVMHKRLDMFIVLMFPLYKVPDILVYTYDNPDDIHIYNFSICAQTHIHVHKYM